MDIPSYDPAAALDFFKGVGEVENIPAGRTIFRENRRGQRLLLQRDKMYLLLKGRVSLVAGAQEIRAVKSGEIFGEMAALGKVPRSASAVAQTPCRVIALDPQQFRKALAKKPAFALMLMKVMVARLREAVARLKRKEPLPGGEPPRETVVQRKELAALVHPDDLPRVLSVLDAVRRGRTPAYDIEHRVRVAGGAWRWIQSRGKVADRDAAGRPLVVTGTNADITARRRAEEMLAARELQLRLVSDSVPAMIVELDAKDRIRYCNSRYADFFGKAAESMIGQTFAQAVDPGAWERFAEQRERVRAGQTVSYERTLARPGKSASMSASGCPT